MPRAQLEAFLEERGFPSKPRAFFSPGFLNQIYVSPIVFFLLALQSNSQ